MGTIEQEITEEHQRELWESPDARMPGCKPAVTADDGDSCEEDGSAGELQEMSIMDLYGFLIRPNATLWLRYCFKLGSYTDPIAVLWLQA